MRYVLIFVLCGLVSAVCAIGLADFVPNFLAAKPRAESVSTHKSTSASGNYVEYAYSSNVKNVGSSAQQTNPTSNYCRDSNGVVSNSVFCNNNSTNGRHMRANPVANPASATNNSGGNFTNRLPSQQSAMQTQALRDAMNKYNSSFMLSVKPEENVDIGVGLSPQGVNGLQIKMKY